MSPDLTREWAAVYPHIGYDEPDAAIDWLVRVFGFRERVRMARPDGTVIVAKLEGPSGGLVMVAGRDEEFVDWIRERVGGVRDQDARPWPNLTHSTTARRRCRCAPRSRSVRGRDRNHASDRPPVGTALLRRARLRRKPVGVRPGTAPARS